MTNSSNFKAPDSTREKVEAFEAGRHAGREGLAPENCPYPEGSELARKWAQGHDAGEKDVKAKLHQHGHGSR